MKQLHLLSVILLNISLIFTTECQAATAAYDPFEAPIIKKSADESLTRESFLEQSRGISGKVSVDYRTGRAEIDVFLDHIIAGGIDDEGKVVIPIGLETHGYAEFSNFLKAVINMEGIKTIEFIDGFPSQNSLRRSDWPYINVMHECAALLATAPSLTDVKGLDIFLMGGENDDAYIYIPSKDEIKSHVLGALSYKRRTGLLLWHTALMGRR